MAVTKERLGAVRVTGVLFGLGPSACRYRLGLAVKEVNGEMWYPARGSVNLMLPRACARGVSRITLGSDIAGRAHVNNRLHCKCLFSTQVVNG